MDAETRKELEALNELIHLPGWDILVSDVEDKVEELKEQVLHPEVTGDLLKIAQGRIIAYREILALPTIVEAALNQEVEVTDDPL